MPKTGFPEDYPDDPVTQFVLQWNLWSTSPQRRAIYRKAWKGAAKRTPLAFITAVAQNQGAEVPEHIAHYLLKNPQTWSPLMKGFEKVRKNNWRLGAVIDQTNFNFKPSVTRLTSCKRKIVMLYVVGDPAA